MLIQGDTHWAPQQLAPAGHFLRQQHWGQPKVLYLSMTFRSFVSTVQATPQNTDCLREANLPLRLAPAQTMPTERYSTTCAMMPSMPTTGLTITQHQSQRSLRNDRMISGEPLALRSVFLSSTMEEISLSSSFPMRGSVSQSLKQR